MFQGLLNTTGVIERATNTVQGDGFISQTWATSSTIKCAIQPRGGSTSQGLPAQVTASSHVGYFEHSVDMRPAEGDIPADRLKVGSIYYTILYVEDMAGRNRYKKAYLKL